MDFFSAQYRSKQRAATNNIEVDPWHFIDKTPFEKVHISFCKFTLGTRKTSSNLGTRLELGRVPVENFILKQSLLYLARLHTDDLNPLLKEAFDLSKSLDSEGVYSWYTYIKNAFADQNLMDTISNCNCIKDVKRLKLTIKNKTFDYYQNLYINKIEKIDVNSKLLLYKNLKPLTEPKIYLSSNDYSIRNIYTKLRISDHNLEIERGRYSKINRDERLCKFCKVVEDENHFILKCSKNENLRQTLFDDIKKDCNNFSDLPDDQKINYLLNPKTSRHVKIIGFFLKRSYELRTEDF